MVKEKFIPKLIVGLIAGFASVVLAFYSAPLLQKIDSGLTGWGVLPLVIIFIPIMIFVYAIILVPLSLILYRRLTKK